MDKKHQKQQYSLLTVLISFFLGLLSTFLIYRFFRTNQMVLKTQGLLATVWGYPILTKDGVSMTIGSLIVSVGLILLGYLVAKSLSQTLAKRIAPKFKIDAGATDSLKNISFYILFAFFTISSLTITHFPMTFFTVAGGALAIGFGFGSQNLMNNFMSGLMIQTAGFRREPKQRSDPRKPEGFFGTSPSPKKCNEPAAPGPATERRVGALPKGEIQRGVQWVRV